MVPCRNTSTGLAAGSVLGPAPSAMRASAGSAPSETRNSPGVAPGQLELLELELVADEARRLGRHVDAEEFQRL